MKMHSVLLFTLFAGCNSFSLRSSLQSVEVKASSVKGAQAPPSPAVAGAPAATPAAAPVAGLMTAPASAGAPAVAPAPASAFSEADGNNDGKITKQEFRLFTLASAAMDKNAAMPKEGDMTMQFGRMDINGDQGLVPSEFFGGAPGPAPAPSAAQGPAPASAPAGPPPCPAKSPYPCGHAMRPTKSPREQEHDQLQHAAHQIAGGAAKALAAVLKSGSSSTAADELQKKNWATMAKADETAKHLSEVEKSRAEASETIKAMDRVKLKAFKTYAEEITKVQVAAPIIPAITMPKKGLDLTRA